jgi:glycosyltransferase involved in cell wall biosynthesis
LEKNGQKNGSINNFTIKLIPTVFLTDFQSGSYKIIGDFFAKSLEPFCELKHIATKPSEENSTIFDSGFQIAFHNTLGEGFVPLKNSYNIALPAHEWSKYPLEWIKLLNEFDEVWSTTDHIKELLLECGLKVPCFKLPPALDTENISSKNDWGIKNKPRFLAVGEPHFRKGHHLLMSGFEKAFPEVGQAQLTIKTSPTCNWESPRKDITIIKDDWSREKLLAEYAKHDHYVSASLGEGLGLPIAEAIMAELPICTNFWGGHKSLLTPGGFIEIGHEEIIQPFTSDPAFYAEGQKCAYSSPESISTALKECISISAEKRKEIVNIAKQFFIQNYGYKVTHKSISNRLEEIKLINSQ